MNRSARIALSGAHFTSITETLASNTALCKTTTSIPRHGKRTNHGRTNPRQSLARTLLEYPMARIRIRQILRLSRVRGLYTRGANGTPAASARLCCHRASSQSSDVLRECGLDWQALQKAVLVLAGYLHLIVCRLQSVSLAEHGGSFLRASMAG